MGNLYSFVIRKPEVDSGLARSFCKNQLLVWNLQEGVLHILNYL